MASFRTLMMASLFALAMAPAFAHEQKGSGGMDMDMPGMEDMVGAHEMSAVVKAIDAKTGLMDVDAGGMKLKVHFPPSTLSDLKVGDKITLHLAFKKS